MKAIPKEVELNIKEYFRDNLPRYEVVKIRMKSYHPNDSHLYMVAAKKDDGTFGVWTGWNDRTRSLNHGHYDLKDLEVCDAVMDEFYYDGK